MNFVDDATGVALCRFSDQETTWAAADLLAAWVRQHGVPKALYCDWKNARAIAYGGNYFNPGDYFTTGTWLIGNCYPTAQFELSYCKPDGEGGLRGIVHAVWIIHDELDLEPGRGRGPVYNTGADILSIIWHDTLGGRRTAPVYVEWEESRGICLSATGQLSFHEVGS